MKWIMAGSSILIAILEIAIIGIIIFTQPFFVGLFALVVGFPFVVITFSMFGLPALGILPEEDENGNPIIRTF